MEAILDLQGEINKNIGVNDVDLMVTTCASGTTEVTEIPLP